MKRAIFGLLALALVTGWASPGWAAGLTLTIRDGRVSLDAQNVTVRQILTEWARVGKTRIVNLDRVNSAPLTMKFDNLPEDQALDIILRTIPGYFAAPRPVPVADASIYDRIALMTTTATVASAPAAAPRPQTQQFFAEPPNSNVTQLRAAPAPLNPGMLPDPSDDPRNSNDPALANAAANGLIAVPASNPGTVSTPSGLLQPPVRNTTPQAPVVTTPSNPWNAPIGTAMPGPATVPPPPAPNPQANRPIGGVRPQQADQ